MAGLDDFFAGAVSVAPLAGEEAVKEAPQLGGASVASAASGDEKTFQEVMLPSQIGVRYYPEPHKYELRQLLQSDKDFFEWTEVPSVSKITKVLDKPGLVHWGEKVGINLVQEGLRNGWFDLEFAEKFVMNEDRHPPWFGGARLQEIGAQKKVTNYWMKDVAAARGNSVHAALEFWAMSGNLPDPDMYDENERGYVEGLNAFLKESHLQPRMSEVVVASVEHKVAGRFDLLGDILEPVELVYHLTEKNAYRKIFQPVRGLMDLKTSTGVFTEYHLQVAGYVGCLVESGYEADSENLPTGFVLRVTKDGRYELVEVQANWLHFWFLRGLFDSIHEIELAARAAAKKGAKT